MDSITQGLLGAVSAQLGFRQRIGRDATWVAAAVAIVPDLDIFVVPILSLTGTEITDMSVSRYHRGLSHSLLMVPVLAAAAAAVWWRLRRRWESRCRAGAAIEPAGTNRRGPPGFGWLLACCLVAVATHAPLDWCTSYGTQILAPITDTRYAIDAAPIIDIIYTPLLILTLLACRVVRRGGSRPGGARRASLIIGWAGFLLSVAYLGAGRLMHDRAVRRACELAGDRHVVAADAFPSLGSIFLWRTVVQTDDAWLVTRLRPLGRLDAAALRAGSAPRVSNAWTRRAEDLPDVRTFKWFAMGRTRWAYERLDGRHVVELHDMRYGVRPESTRGLWGLRVTFNDAGEVLGVGRVMHYRGSGRWEMLKSVWKDMWAP